MQTVAYDQRFLTEAPVVLVICATVQGYLDGRTSGVQDLGEIGVFNDEICEILHKKTKEKSQMSIEILSRSVAFNVAIAIEHIVLRALDFGLGTCWMRLIDVNAIREVFNWDENIYPVALLPIGYPLESPRPRKGEQLRSLCLTRMVVPPVYGVCLAEQGGPESVYGVVDQTQYSHARLRRGHR